MLVLPEINFLHLTSAYINILHLILPVTLLLVGGWMTPTPSRAHPFHRGEGGLMGYDHDHGRGGGGGTRNLEHIYIYIYPFFCAPSIHLQFFDCPPTGNQSNMRFLLKDLTESPILKERKHHRKLTAGTSKLFCR